MSSSPIDRSHPEDSIFKIEETSHEHQQSSGIHASGPCRGFSVRGNDDSAYWSERFGWGELDDATAFFETVPEGLTSNVTAEWVDAELAIELRAEAEADASPRD